VPAKSLACSLGAPHKSSLNRRQHIDKTATPRRHPYHPNLTPQEPVAMPESSHRRKCYPQFPQDLCAARLLKHNVSSIRIVNTSFTVHALTLFLIFSLCEVSQVCLSCTPTLPSSYRHSGPPLPTNDTAHITAFWSRWNLGGVSAYTIRMLLPRKVEAGSVKLSQFIMEPRTCNLAYGIDG
jgi:hypothetical protein